MFIYGFMDILATCKHQKDQIENQTAAILCDCVVVVFVSFSLPY